MGFSLFEVQLIRSDFKQVTPTYTPNTKIVFAHDEFRDIVLLELILTSTDTVPHLVTIWRGYDTISPDTILQVVPVPAGAGNGTVPAVDVLVTLQPAPTGLVLVMRTNALWFSLGAAPSADKIVYLSTVSGMF